MAWISSFKSSQRPSKRNPRIKPTSLAPRRLTGNTPSPRAANTASSALSSNSPTMRGRSPWASNRVAQRYHPRHAHARDGLRGLSRDHLRRGYGHSRDSGPQWRVRREHPKVAMPVGARRWHQGGNSLDQLPRCEVQLIHPDAALVAGRLAVLFGAAVHQLASSFGDKGRPCDRCADQRRYGKKPVRAVVV